MRIFYATAVIPGSRNTANPRKPWGSQSRGRLEMTRSRKIQIQISPALNDQLNRAAKRSGVTKSAFVRVALEREFALDQMLDQSCRQKGSELLREGSETPSRQPTLFKLESFS